ncbi:hypothetical protein HU200_021035 [Digitaria exilis]|uniref:Glycosyltransferase 61 catalytic domain-containing protein n=1 Tax=Digitaria exilis TaxID=1010633 RepID=A0A835K9G7_9POAL|nr:hypothetical protein HU200_021035 [Digitaria exilis]CAB3472613.1 unnamed protein product [Digitaria exilis]
MAASKSFGLKAAAMDDAAAIKQNKRRWALAIQFAVALAVLTLCVLLYAPRFFSAAPSPYGSIPGFFSPASTSAASSSSSSSSVVAQHLDGLEHAAGEGGADASPEDQPVVLDNQVGSPCSSLLNNTICCDRSDYHSDVCFMSGDVRTDAASLSLLLFPPPASASGEASSFAAVEERIRPYTRKWDSYVTKSIHEVTLRTARPEEVSGDHHRCDVRHDAPAFVATAGGYSHNMFHVFNDGFLPMWLTSQHLRRRVVLVALSYNHRWAGTYGDLISTLTGHRRHVIDLLADKRTHCFPGAIVGTRYHDYLSVNSTRLRDNKTIVDFHNFLADAYSDDIVTGEKPVTKTKTSTTPQKRPRLGIVSRKGRRVIENQEAVARLASSVGFEVDIMETATGLPMSAVYETVSSYDALVGVHGADLTSFLFLRPGAAAFVQVAPLGITLLSRNLFGVPAARMGVHYEQYDMGAGESSLSRRYPAGHVVVADPARARREQGKGEWELVEHVYLRGQNVSLDLGRFRETLVRIHSWLKEQQLRNPGV